MNINQNKTERARLDGRVNTRVEKALQKRLQQAAAKAGISAGEKVRQILDASLPKTQ